MLEELLTKKEGKTLEFKENTKFLPKIIQNIVAFANIAGGTLIIGIIGIKDKTKTQDQIQQCISKMYDDRYDDKIDEIFFEKKHKSIKPESEKLFKRWKDTSMLMKVSMSKQI